MDRIPKLVHIWITILAIWNVYNRSAAHVLKTQGTGKMIWVGTLVKVGCILWKPPNLIINAYLCLAYVTVQYKMGGSPLSCDPKIQVHYTLYLCQPNIWPPCPNGRKKEKGLHMRDFPYWAWKWRPHSIAQKRVLGSIWLWGKLGSVVYTSIKTRRMGIGEH